ncbi:17806_t:CDS:2 [Gigaspora margarita]|uniref:17806_t:CDS:1 n=1 Tax=Gigaspora margarita TaxID=4874 RepID=A0ABN7UHH7_GIGMA|nr:17806_t:CDS:2 [Gigaspora margarita]
MSLFYNLATVAIIIFFLTGLSTGLSQVIKYSNFTYTETSSQANLTENPPHILAISHYQNDESTSIVHIGRENYVIGSNLCLEQRLLLRVLQGNGSVIEINFNNTEEIQDINFCYPNEFIVNNIVPRNGFLRLCRVRRTNNFEWKQYGRFDHGSFSLLQHDTFITDSTDLTNFQVTVLQTLDNGYAIIYSNTLFTSTRIYAMKLKFNEKTTIKFNLYELTQPNTTFTGLFCSVDYVYVGHLCVVSVASTMVSQTPTNTTVITTTTLAPLTTPVTTPLARPTTSTIQVIYHLKIRFLSSGSVLTTDQVIPNENSATARILPLGGYALILQQPFQPFIYFNFSLYNESNQLVDYSFPINPIISNIFGAFDILQNNTMMVARNELSTIWSLVSIQLPSLSLYNYSGYGNFHVNTTYPRKDSNNLEVNCNKINITFQDPVSFANGNLSIYQISNQVDILRQIINSKNCIDNCIAKDNVVTLDVYDSTFNEPGAKYYIQMDNKFVQNSIYDEAIMGIDPYIWIFQTANVDISQSSSHAGDIRGIVRLTKSGTQYFRAMNNSEKGAFITALINELTVIIPTERGRLSSNGRYQLDTTVESQFLISFSINKAKDSEKFLSTLVSKYLSQLIKNGVYTGISTGTTTIYLDYTYGFQQTLNK